MGSSRKYIFDHLSCPILVISTVNIKHLNSQVIKPDIEKSTCIFVEQVQLVYSYHFINDCGLFASFCLFMLVPDRLSDQVCGAKSLENIAMGLCFMQDTKNSEFDGDPDQHQT